MRVLETAPDLNHSRARLPSRGAETNCVMAVFCTCSTATHHAMSCHAMPAQVTKCVHHAALSVFCVSWQRPQEMRGDGGTDRWVALRHRLRVGPREARRLESARVRAYL